MFNTIQINVQYQTNNPLVMHEQYSTWSRLKNLERTLTPHLQKIKKRLIHSFCFLRWQWQEIELLSAWYEKVKYSLFPHKETQSKNNLNKTVPSFPPIYSSFPKGQLYPIQFRKPSINPTCETWLWSHDHFQVKKLKQQRQKSIQKGGGNSYLR